MRIFVTSYPYVYERHTRIFDFFKNKKDLTLILPSTWLARDGKLIVHPPEKPDIEIIKTSAYFHHSHYPVIRGLMKGWMPWTPFILWRRAECDDVLLTSIEPNLIVTLINGITAKLLGMKHVCITWQNIPFEQRLSGTKLAITNWLIRTNLALSAGIMCGTQKAYEVNKHLFPPHLKVAVIPQSGVDSDIFRPDAPSDFRKKYNLEEKLVYVFAAVFDERKGVFTTIDAFMRTLAELPSAHLVMIGMGKLWDQAKAMIEEKKLNDHVTFIPWLPNHELAGIFSAADVLVHPSEPYRGWEEQYGWTMLQADASGLPVIATRIGSIPETVLDGKTGILIEPKNPEALARAMIHLGQNPELRAEMGRAGREYILSKLSHKAVAERMEHFLHSL